MMEPRLHKKLSALEWIFRRARLWRRLAICWAALGGVGLILVLLRVFTGWNSILPGMLLLGAGLIAVVVWIQEKRRPADFRAVVNLIEQDHPEVRPLLSTAVEQVPDPDLGRFGFLQLRVIEEVLTHRHGILWERDLKQRLASARAKHIFALVAFILIVGLATNSRSWHLAAHSLIADELTVTPGDTQVERGTGLVISARFAKAPPEATLILSSASGKMKRLPLERHLADPVFGASLSEISEDGVYRIEYGTKKSREYKITVFDFPSLVQADALLHFPDYTGLTNKAIRDTRRVSAVEGTRLSYTLQLNKTVAHARLVGQDQVIPLTAQTNAVALLKDWAMTNSGHYSLELVDADGRTNKFPADFTFHVLPDRRPDVKIAFPRGDQRVSLLEELQLQAEASDDFGVLKYGIGFGVAGQEPQFVEIGQTVPANEKRQFNHLVAMEKLGVEVNQAVSYFAWADDYGPDGQVRRSFSDMFFAEIRPFEEIFRRDQSGSADSGGQQNGNQGQGNQGTRLAELQKQIVIATWKLQREKEGTTARIKP